MELSYLSVPTIVAAVAFLLVRSALPAPHARPIREDNALSVPASSGEEEKPHQGLLRAALLGMGLLLLIIGVALSALNIVLPYIGRFIIPPGLGNVSNTTARLQGATPVATVPSTESPPTQQAEMPQSTPLASAIVSGETALENVYSDPTGDERDIIHSIPREAKVQIYGRAGGTPKYPIQWVCIAWGSIVGWVIKGDLHWQSSVPWEALPESGKCLP